MRSAIEPKMIELPAGEYVIGEPACPDDADLHWRWHSGSRVQVKAFAMGATCVTNAEYIAYMDDTGAEAPSHIHVNGFDGEEQPVGGISWEDASAYCQWLSQSSGKAYRLPTDSEWEYAARGGMSGKRFPWEGDLSLDHAWYGGQAAPKPVGQYEPNGFGLYDVVGNIWEWCDNVFEDVSDGIPSVNTPTGKDPSVNRVLRGGSYLSTIEFNLWVAYRHEDPPDLRHECLGFRVALSC